MRTYGNLWAKVIAWENLLLAARKARRGKRNRGCGQRFELDLEYELLRLREELTARTYRPGEFRTHWITRPKPRLISAAPYRDRVIHHALMNVLEPILERHFHPHSYACRKGKGTHAAADRLRRLMRRHRYVLQCDVRKYFPSIDHEVLKRIFRRLIRDREVLSLMDLIVDHSNAQEAVVEYFAGDDLFSPHQRRRGLPIGNLTSQWLANWYLSALDFFVTDHVGIGAYVRYCDDFLLLDDDPGALRAALRKIVAKLATMRLRLHEHRSSVVPARTGARFVGYRIWPTHRLIRKPNIRQFRRRVRWMRRAYARGEAAWRDIRLRLDSWIGHARQANSERLLARVSREWRFPRGPRA